MELTNDNLVNENERKEQMINTYEVDIHELKEKKKEQENQLEFLNKKLLDNERDEMLPSLKE